MHDRPTPSTSPADRARQERAQQGLPATVTDAEVLRRVVRITLRKPPSSVAV